MQTHLLLLEMLLLLLLVLALRHLAAESMEVLVCGLHATQRRSVRSALYAGRPATCFI